MKGIVFIVILIVMIILYLCGCTFAGIYLLCTLGLFIAVCVYIEVRNQYWNNLLDWKCEPQKYLKIMKKQLIHAKKNEAAQQSYQINIAVAHMCMGNYEDAKKQLLEIDETRLSEKTATLLVYTIDLIECYYRTGELAMAEKLYETNLVRLSPVNQRLKISVDLLIGERYYYLGSYDESYEYFKKLLTFDLKKRQYLTIQYWLARIELQKGEKASARKRLNKIVKLGNELGIVKEAQQMLGSSDGME